MGAGALVAAVPPAWAADCGSAEWPLWQMFAKRFVQPDGRVLDASTPQRHSSSEGQSYGMFFALVADDRPRFELLWRWSVSNLFGGTVQGRLPAWFWGQAPDGSWRVLDENSASDANLWFAYALAEGARRWSEPAYARDARALLATVESLEVSEVPGLGTMLRPGTTGFMHEGGRRWQFNPSYMPVPVLRRLAALSPKGPWSRIASNTAALMQQAAKAHGMAPDWIAYGVDAQGHWGFQPHADKGAVGSYDAIRTYLWAGMTPPSDPLAASLMQSLRGLAAVLARTGALPESVDTLTGQVTGSAPLGFYAAFLPYLQASQAPAALIQATRLRVEQGLDKLLSEQPEGAPQPPYYDIVLSLFGLGWAQGRYRFSAVGELLPRRTSGCTTGNI